MTALARAMRKKARMLEEKLGLSCLGALVDWDEKVEHAVRSRQWAVAELLMSFWNRRPDLESMHLA